MSKSVRVGEGDAGGLAMVAEQGAETGRGHACAACRSFQRDEQRGSTWIGPFQPQIVIEQLDGFRRQRKEAKFTAFAANANLCFGKQCVVPIQSQHFGRPQPLQEHQTHDGQVARCTEAGPEARHLIHRQRDNVALGRLYTYPAYHHARPSQAHWPTPQEGLMKASGNLAGSVREVVTQGAVDDGGAVVDGGGGWPWLLAGLETHILEQGRFGEVVVGNVAGVMNALPSG